MTKKLFNDLSVYADASFCSAAMNMAIDETLLEIANAPSIRFYRWDHPALSFGYAGKFADLQSFETERDLVRRWTGGGIVFHGSDLTYSIVIPANDPVFTAPSITIYEETHRAIQLALTECGKTTELAAMATVAHRRHSTGACFANSVRADVMLNGRKIAGAAQRRTRYGLLQQGSIQDVDLAEDFEQKFVRHLAERATKREIETSILNRAETIAAQKYATDAWLRKR